MSEKQNRDFSKYDSMSTEELEALLRLDADAPADGESDVELILHVMEVLVNRGNTNDTGKTALESWESFQQLYLSEENPSADASKKHVSPWVRRLIAAAAVIVLVVCVPLTARGLGLADLWNVIAKWAKETFSFVSGEDTQMSEPEKEDSLQYTSLQDALLKKGLDADIVPTWIPEGYVLDKVEIENSPMQEIYNAYYMKEDKALTIRIRTYMDTDPEKIEVNETPIEIYENSDVQYYLFNNVNLSRAVWITDCYEGVISGELTIEEIKMMIDSVDANP